MAASLTALSEAVLALATGAGCGAVGTFVVARHVWQRAQAQGKCIDRHIEDLRSLHAPHSRGSGQQGVPTPSLFELQLKKELVLVWNKNVWGMYETLRDWL